MTPPTFIMSLDCEGKWGMADMLEPYHHRLITSANLRKAYRQLLDMLARHEISSTFAFVMALALRDEEKARFPILDPKCKPDDPWLKYYWRCLDAGLREGWHEPAVFDMVRDAGCHEIASHSFCHRALGDTSADAAAASAELGFAHDAGRLKGVDLKTLVFPRNEVGNLGAVRAAGYLGFRADLDRPSGRLGRAVALAAELDVWASPQESPARQEGLIPIPPGHFFNWRYGIRRLLPPAVTRMRWRNQLARCVERGGVVHMWLHPHNLITAPATAEVLNGVLAEVGRLRDRGAIAVLTQRDYCERAAA